MKKLGKLFFGTAGIPLSTLPRNTLNGISEVKNLGLEAMELEFVQNVNINEELAVQVKDMAVKNDVILTCHGQYFINLNSLDKKKLEASQQRIYIASKRAFQCGGWSTCFHPGFYQGQSVQNTFASVKNALHEVVSRLENEGVDIWVRPETTGKGTQFGSLDELIDLSLAIGPDKVLPCVDFSHLYARSNGKFNSLEEFHQVLSELEKRIGKEAIQNMHIHAQGVEFSEKGERRHLPFADSGFNYKDLVKALKTFSAKGVLICESPVMENDALIIQKVYQKL